MLQLYGRQFQDAGAAQRNACHPIFVREEHGSSCLSSADDLDVCRKTRLVIRNLRYAGSPDSRSFYVKVAILWSMRHLTGSQWSSLIVWKMLIWHRMTCDNASQCFMDTSKSRNVRARDPREGLIGVVRSTANEGASNALGTVNSETSSDVAECPDMVEARFGEPLRRVGQRRACCRGWLPRIVTLLETWT